MAFKQKGGDTLRSSCLFSYLLKLFHRMTCRITLGLFSLSDIQYLRQVREASLDETNWNKIVANSNQKTNTPFDLQFQVIAKPGYGMWQLDEQDNTSAPNVVLWPSTSVNRTFR